VKRGCGDVDPRDEGEGENVEDDVPTRDATRRVPLRETESRHRRLPAPRADGGAVQLETHDDHEDSCVDRPARPDEDADQERAADRAGDVGLRENRDTGDPPGRSDRSGDEEEHPRAVCEHGRQRQTREIDEPVARRHERGKVVEPVGVETPYERADDLADRRDRNDRQRLDTHLRRMSREECSEDADREDTERKLARMSDVLVDDEPAEGPGGDGEQCDQLEAVHHRIFVDAAAGVRSNAR
jgi:hypothetical protein